MTTNQLTSAVFEKSRKMDQEEAPIIHGLDFQVIILIDSLEM